MQVPVPTELITHKKLNVPAAWVQVPGPYTHIPIHREGKATYGVGELRLHQKYLIQMANFTIPVS